MFRCLHKNNNQHNCFQHLLRMYLWAAYQHIGMTSEGSCHTKNWNNRCWKFSFAMTGSCILKYITMEKFVNCNNISQYYCIFDEINAALVIIRGSSKKHLNPKHSDGCGNFIQERNMAHSSSLIEINASNAYFWAVCCRWSGCSWTDYICSKLMRSSCAVNQAISYNLFSLRSFWNAATAFTVTTVFCHTAAWYHGKSNQYYYLECTWRWSSVPDMPRTSLSSNKPLVQSCLNDIKACFLSIYMTARGDVYACLYMWRSEWVYLCWPCRYASSCTFVMNNAKAQWWSYTSAFLQAFALAGAGNELCIIVYVLRALWRAHLHMCI